jgi:GNAT superfamily N-acetyltransferase
VLEERALTLADIPVALALSTEAGWNQSAADWALLLTFGRGFALLGPDASIVATAVVVPYERRFAWIGMVIVTAAFRRLGLATRLLQRCITTICASGAVPVLDATPAGREVYRKLGFVDTWELQRYAGAGMARAATASAAEARIRRLNPADLEQLRAFDGDAFGADRFALLDRLRENLPEAALVAEHADGTLAGMAFQRPGRTATQIGPVIAADARVALALIAHAVRTTSGSLLIDVPLEHTRVNEWLEAQGFAVERPLTRMQYDVATPFGRLDRTFAIAGPEIG